MNIFKRKIMVGVWITISNKALFILNSRIKNVKFNKLNINEYPAIQYNLDAIETKNQLRLK